jgi:hypothetical protein
VHLLFLDEFGDFSDPRTSIKSQSYRPICGYAGILIPAQNYRSFCDHFMEFRVIAMNAGAYARYTASQGTQGVKLSFDEFIQLLASPTNRMTILQEEIKGSELFSTSFFSKQAAGLGRKRRNILRYARMFLTLLHKHDATIFYSGILKEPYFKRFKTTDQGPARPLHVELVRNVLEVAYKIAQAKQSQIKMIFDHHQKDDETKARIQARQERKPSFSIAKLQTREEYSKEVMLEKGYYPYIKEPAFNIRSHWSLGVQAADWICSLLGKLKSYEVSPSDFEYFSGFHDKLYNSMNDLAENESALKYFAQSQSKQLRLPLGQPNT